jgi:hypothetical protein
MMMALPPRKRPYLGLEVEGGKGSLPVVRVASSSEGAMSTGVEEEERKRTNRGCLPLVLGTSLKGWPCIASEITIALPNMKHKGQCMAAPRVGEQPSDSGPQKAPGIRFRSGGAAPFSSPPEGGLQAGVRGSCQGRVGFHQSDLL